MADDFVAVGQEGDLASGQMRLVNVGDKELLLARVGDDFFAVESVCTHAFGYLDQGRIRGTEIECPLHGGCFDLRTGEPTEEHVSYPLQTFDVRVENGTVYVGAARPLA
jgi:nitrite reductase/ring-hydroxylating ferredoxin subunit